MSELTLAEALKQAKDAIAENPGAWELPAGLLDDLISAVEEHLKEDRESTHAMRRAG